MYIRSSNDPAHIFLHMPTDLSSSFMPREHVSGNHLLPLTQHSRLLADPIISSHIFTAALFRCPRRDSLICPNNPPLPPSIVPPHDLRIRAYSAGSSGNIRTEKSSLGIARRTYAYPSSVPARIFFFFFYCFSCLSCLVSVFGGSFSRGVHVCSVTGIGGPMERERCRRCRRSASPYVCTHIRAPVYARTL